LFFSSLPPHLIFLSSLLSSLLLPLYCMFRLPLFVRTEYGDGD
jgi:hypothetical protein